LEGSPVPRWLNESRREGAFRRLQSAALLAFSLLLALLYWVYTVSADKSLKDLTVPLEFVNVPEKMAVVADNIPRLVTVEVKGSPEMLRRVREEDVDAKIDVSKLRFGPQILEIGRENVRLPSSVEFAQVLPRVIHFSIEKKAQAELPLEPSFEGRTVKGTQILSWSIEPANTRIEGPEGELARIKKAPTQPVNVEGRTQGFQVPVVPLFSDPDIKVLEPGPFTLSVVIGEKRAQRTIGPVPIGLLNAKQAFTVTPPSLKIMVDGPASVVAGLGPQDFVAELNLVGLKPTEQSYQLLPAVRFANPALSSKVQITSWSQRYVEVRAERDQRAGGGGGEP
jgi:hypothetical protein